MNAHTLIEAEAELTMIRIRLNGFYSNGRTVTGDQLRELYTEYERLKKTVIEQRKARSHDQR